MKCLRSPEPCDRGFESHLGHGYLVCICVYFMLVLSCISVAALRRADHSSKSPTACEQDQETEKRPGPTRTVEPFKKKKKKKKPPSRHTVFYE
jgi:hypothetical protein